MTVPRAGCVGCRGPNIATIPFFPTTLKMTPFKVVYGRDLPYQLGVTKVLAVDCWDLRLDHQTEKVDFGRGLKHKRNELHNRNCTIVRTKCSHPYNVGWGVFIPPILITSYQKCPSGPHEGQEITLGVFGNFPKSDSPTWILLHGSHVSCPSGTFGSGLQQASCGAAFIVRHS